MYADLQSDIKEYLDNEEDIFGLPVILEAPPNTEATVDIHLKQEGVVLIVGKARQTARPGAEVNIQVPLVIIENNEVNNRGSLGIVRTPDQIITDVISSLDRVQPSTFWTPIKARPFDSRDPEFGTWGYGIMVETKTLITREWAVLQDHNGNAIAEHNWKVFLTTNRGR